MRNFARINNYYNRIQAQADFDKLAKRLSHAGYSGLVEKHMPPEGAGWRKIDKCIARLRKEIQTMDTNLLYAYFDEGDVEIAMTIEQAESASHPGPCDNDVEDLLEEIRDQLDKHSPEVIARCLHPYGAWDDDELKDHEQNLLRITWIAACGISEEYHWDDEN